MNNVVDISITHDSCELSVETISVFIDTLLMELCVTG